MKNARWFIPGMGIKRWLAVSIAGMLLFGMGAGGITLSLYQRFELPNLLYRLTQFFIEYWMRGAVVLLAGFGLLCLGLFRIHRVLMEPFAADMGDKGLIDLLYHQRTRATGPRIVVLGGGPGLSLAMQGLQAHTGRLTAISLGQGPARTRTELDLKSLPVTPATEDTVDAVAHLADGGMVEGIVEIRKRVAGAPIDRIELRPSTPNASVEAITSIRRAEAIVIGPGDLFGSVLPPIQVPGIARAIRDSSARKIFVCNIMTQAGKTNGFTVADHVRAIQRATSIPIDYVIINNRPISEKLISAYRTWKQSEVVFSRESSEDFMRISFANGPEEYILIDGAFVIERDVITGTHDDLLRDAADRETRRSLHVIRHDAAKLGRVIQAVMDETWRRNPMPNAGLASTQHDRIVRVVGPW